MAVWLTGQDEFCTLRGHWESRHNALCCVAERKRTHYFVVFAVLS